MWYLEDVDGDEIVLEMQPAFAIERLRLAHAIHLALVERPYPQRQQSLA